jgi:MerR family transcriptional regulator/heat shock protein HspR
MATRRPPAPGPHEPAAPVFVISVAAELSGLHPQTLRTYERMGLITPGRTGGGGRRYSADDIDRLRTIAQLTSAGIGIEGVRRILDLENTVSALRARNEELIAELHLAREALRRAAATAPTAVPPSPPSRLPVVRPPSGEQAIVVWRRPR